MDFIFSTLQLYVISLKYLATWVFGILPALILLVAWRFIRKERTLIRIDGKIESIGDYHQRSLPDVFQSIDKLNFGFIKKITFVDKGTRIFFKKGIIRSYLWKNIGGSPSLAGLEGTFLGVVKRKHIELFAFANSGTAICFLDDLDRPHSMLRIVWNVVWRMLFILFSPYMFYDLMNQLHQNKYYDLVNRSHQASRLESLTGFMAYLGLIIFGYSLYCYCTGLARQRTFFQQQLQLVREAGMPVPLG